MYLNRYKTPIGKRFAALCAKVDKTYTKMVLYPDTIEEDKRRLDEFLEKLGDLEEYYKEYIEPMGKRNRR